jgi:ABC-2 type transport system ATP-binding protein
MGATSAVAFSGLTKRFGRVLAVDDVSLDVPTGAVFGLLGPNGSGKTTLLSMLAGFLRPTAGSITLLGRSGPAGLREALGSVGALIERPTFWPFLSCRDNLRCLQGIYGSNGSDAEVDELLATVNLDDQAAHRKFAVCSTGMKQRLGIAATLLGNPSLIILDEPTNGLDPVGIIEVRELIRTLTKSGKPEEGGRRTIILASHLLNEVEQVCDRVGVMVRGRLVYSGPVSGMGAPMRVLVRTTDDARAAELLASAGWEVAGQSGSGLEITASPGQEWEISRDLANAGFYVVEMRALGRSLEAGFMEVTAEPEPEEASG